MHSFALVDTSARSVFQWVRAKAKQTDPTAAAENSHGSRQGR